MARLMAWVISLLMPTGPRNGHPAHQARTRPRTAAARMARAFTLSWYSVRPPWVAEVRVRAVALEGGPQLIEQGGGEGVVLAATGRVHGRPA